MQFKGRHIYVTGIIFLKEAHRAWVSQQSQEQSAKYSAARALEGGRTMAVQLARLQSQIKNLPAWGFPENSGFAMMPCSLYQHACQLATDFVGLVVESMSAALWDSCFWSVNAPNCFAALIHWFDDDFENPGPSPEQKAGPSPEEQAGPSPEKAADVKQKHQLMKLLSDLRERWNCIFIVEKLLFKKIPTDSADVQEQFQESANEHPELAKWYYFLDGVTDQLTREIVAILSSWSWGIQALRDHGLQARLRHTFAAPSSTKTWNEDVFRDLRASYVNVPDSRVSCWSRQKQSMVSLQNRDRKLIMPVLNSGHASRRSQQAFQNFQHKKLVTNSIFSPATNPAKAKRCQEQGRKFDCGYATKTGLNPLIDLKPLVSPGQGQAQQKKSEAGPSPADTGSLFLLPASKLANYMAASAWSFLDIKRSLFAQHRFGDLETALAKRWIGNFLCCGGVFNIRGRYSLSLGFFGYAAQMCQLNHLEVGEDMYFSLKARRRGRRLVTCMFCKQPNQTA